MYLSALYQDMWKVVELVDFSRGYRVDDFDCGIGDYNDFLCKDAPYYIEQSITQVKLLINKQNADIIAYMALCSDSFVLDDKEKESAGLDVPFKSVPALKIGKLAVSRNYKQNDTPYGSFMLFLAMAYLERLNEIGVGCRYLVVDADVEHNPGVLAFYEKNGFLYNEAVNRRRSVSVSMRCDVFKRN